MTAELIWSGQYCRMHCTSNGAPSRTPQFATAQLARAQQPSSQSGTTAAHPSAAAQAQLAQLALSGAVATHSRTLVSGGGAAIAPAVAGNRGAIGWDTGGGTAIGDDGGGRGGAVPAQGPRAQREPPTSDPAPEAAGCSSRRDS